MNRHMEINDGDSFAVAYPFALGIRNLIAIDNKTPALRTKRLLKHLRSFDDSLPDRLGCSL